MKKIILFILVFSISNCSNIKISENSKIRIKGSDTMLHLNQRLAEAFMTRNKGISVYVEGGGSRTGINALMNSKVEICAASRPLEPYEIEEMGEKFHTVGMSFLIGRDALSIYINPQNKIKNLTLDQIAKIYSCEIKNWKEVGGADELIIPVSRSSASGTHLYFVKHILRGVDICDSIKVLNTTDEIINFVRSNKYAIGYGGIGYGDSSMKCVIENIKPTTQNVLNNTYPISRYLRYYTINKPEGTVKKFIDWVSSKEGQNIVKSMGYVPLWN